MNKLSSEETRLSIGPEISAAECCSIIHANNLSMSSNAKWNLPRSPFLSNCWFSYQRVFMFNCAEPISETLSHQTDTDMGLWSHFQFCLHAVIYVSQAIVYSLRSNKEVGLRLRSSIRKVTCTTKLDICNLHAEELWAQVILSGFKQKSQKEERWN